jgi:signal transduction histidine kinase
MRAPRWPSWSRSFYWRIAVSFVVLVIGVLIAQSFVFSYMMARSSPTFLSPNILALTVAADVQDVLESDPSIDLQRYLEEKYRTAPLRLYVMLKDGRVVGNSTVALPDDIRRATAATLAGNRRDATLRMETTGPIVTSPIQIDNQLRGIVVLPPPPPGGVVRAVGRALSVPGTAILIVATIIASLFIFRPARQRLLHLESAAERLGAGDLGARAPDSGADEIARVARAFNKMAAELAARDEALHTSDRLRRQMVADVSHELKTPLTSMRGYLETLRMPEMVISQEARGRYLDTIEHETRRLERIVEDLVDLGRLENGVVTLDCRYFATEQVFRHVVERHEREAKERDVELISDVNSSADQLFADPDRLEQVIENLVANAFRHTPAGGVIQLHAAAGVNDAHLSVTDSGSGIAPEHVPHIFDRFYKVDASRVAGAAGSGLGLSIAKAIVERHGGTMSVNSRPGRTEFVLMLPQDRGAIPIAHSTSANL